LSERDNIARAIKLMIFLEMRFSRWRRAYNGAEISGEKLAKEKIR